MKKNNIFMFFLFKGEREKTKKQKKNVIILASKLLSLYKLQQIRPARGIHNKGTTRRGQGAEEPATQDPEETPSGIA